MAQSQLDLYNKALGVVGADYTIASTSEDSTPAEACNLWYETARQSLLRAAHWNCAKRHIRLTEVTERDLSADWVAGDPEPGYGFSYDVPTSMLAARYLTTLEQFSLGYDTSHTKKIISCNTGGSAATDAPVLCYTIDITDPTLWEPDFYAGLAYALAGHIAQPLTGKRGKAADAFSMANELILQARAATANELQRKLVQVPESLQARGYLGYPISDPYIYPYGNMFNGTGAPVV